MTSEIAEKLDQLANYQAQKDYLNLQKQELIDQVLTPEIKARLEEIETEFGEKILAVDENIEALENEVKKLVIRNGSSVKGTFLRAVWNKGRISWDTRSMDEYAIHHPEILAFRKQGEPFVRIVKINS